MLPIITTNCPMCGNDADIYYEDYLETCVEISCSAHYSVCELSLKAKSKDVSLLVSIYESIPKSYILKSECKIDTNGIAGMLIDRKDCIGFD